MEDLRRCWKVPYIVYYCNLFEQKLDLIDLRVDEFEDALLDDCGNERNITIVHLLQKLIKPFTNRSIDLTNFDQYLLQVLRRYHLDFILTSSSQDNLYNSWTSLSILAKLDIIFRLCELRLSLNDIETKLSDYEASELRVEPLAVDSAGTRFWYFGDLRLYEERKPERRAKIKMAKKKVEKKAAVRSTRSSRRLRAKDEQPEEEPEEEEEESEEEVDVEELDMNNYEDTLRKELKYWSCVCESLEEWHALHERLKGSGKQPDEEMAELIESQYLPEMPALFQKAEREKQQRLQAMQPKRQSQRLQSRQVASVSENEWDVMASDEFSKLAPEEQERVRREEIARARQQRLEQRLAKRDNALNDSNNDEISQEAHSVRSNDSDFNIKNYFLMYKVLQKVLQCKYSWPFKDAVSEEDAPDYNSIIQNPMDLSTIQLKINNKIYKSRREFISDLELIVQNCLTYNGDDTFYGKLALKFENFFKRWLQIFYPREISASLEEKNRQLMKLINGSDLSAENGDEPESQNGADATAAAAAADDTNSQSLHTNENSQLTETEAGTVQPIDFSDTSFLNGTMRKKRKPNPDKDKYIQEPEYVTKRTSSGRLVKMKISTEFEYASDEERPGPGRPRKRDLHLDDGTFEGIQQRHCSSPGQISHYASSSDSNQDEDDDFITRSKSKTGHKKGTRKYVRKRDQFGNLIPRRPKKTIADLTGPVRPGLAHIFESGEDESCLETRRHLTNNPANILRQQPSNLNLKTNGEYTFEQYVKKINSNCTVGQALAVADAVKAACSTSPDKNQETARPPPLRVSAASTSAARLTIPVINPSIKATLGRLQQQPVVVGSGNENGKVKLISVNGSGDGGLAGKRLLIINKSTGGQSKPMVLNNGASNFKIINIKSACGTVNASRPLVMINKNVQEVRVEKKMESEAGGPGERGVEVDSGSGGTVTSVKSESEVNGHVN